MQSWHSPDLCILYLAKAIVTKLIVSGRRPHLNYMPLGVFLMRGHRLHTHMALWKAPMMLISISISAGFHTILSWVIIVVEESWLLVDLYTGIRDGSVNVPSCSSHPFIFPLTLREYPFLMLVGSKHCSPFHQVCRK